MFGLPNLTDPNVIRSAASGVWGSLKPLIQRLPAQVTYQGKTYRRDRALGSVDSALWYVAALAMTGGNAAIKAAFGMRFDGEESFDGEALDCDACEGDDDGQEIDPVTITLITAIIGAVVALAPTIIGLFNKPPAEAAAATTEVAQQAAATPAAQSVSGTATIAGPLPTAQLSAQKDNTTVLLIAAGIALFVVLSGEVGAA